MIKRFPGWRPENLPGDRERLRQALYADLAGESDRESAVRHHLLTVITRERTMGLLPNDTFDTLLHAAGSASGRKTLLQLFPLSSPRKEAAYA